MILTFSTKQAVNQDPKVNNRGYHASYQAGRTFQSVSTQLTSCVSLPKHQFWNHKVNILLSFSEYTKSGPL